MAGRGSWNGKERTAVGHHEEAFTATSLRPSYFFRAACPTGQPGKKLGAPFSEPQGVLSFARSEERRVGKECRSQWWADKLKKNRQWKGIGARGRRGQEAGGCVMPAVM